MVRYVLREMIDGSESEIISDSLTTVLNLRMDERKDVLVANLNINTRESKKYLLMINTTDLLRNRGTTNYIHIDRSTINTAQNFLVTNASNQSPAFDPVFTSDETFNIRYNRKGIDSVYIKYYENDFPLPRPPITNLRSPVPEFRADSIYAYPYSDTMNYMLPFEGMYHIQIDPTQPAGLSLFNFGENYPRVSMVDEMIGPLAYLSSSIEFNELINQTNKKLAVDNFWLKAAGNVQSARELIRVYYNRVFFANFFFTSYKEGWKTDRGMMFVVYGPPNLLTKRGDTEIWVYYRKKSREPIQFTFLRHENQFSQNDYMLERNYVNSMWSQAVQDWRRGRIFYTESH
jgi:GWxTD domain-containing protein